MTHRELFRCKYPDNNCRPGVVKKVKSSNKWYSWYCLDPFWFHGRARDRTHFCTPPTQPRLLRRKHSRVFALFLLLFFHRFFVYTFIPKIIYFINIKKIVNKKNDGIKGKNLEKKRKNCGKKRKNRGNKEIFSSVSFPASGSWVSFIELINCIQALCPPGPLGIMSN